MFAPPNVLPPDEAADGFRLIFDGRSLGAWTAPKDNWDVAEGALHLRHKGGSVFWSERKLPDDFELRFEWMVGPEGNSGVHYRGGQFEYQILDNRAERRYKAEVSAGAIYNIAGPPADVTRPPMQWNSGRILCRGWHIRHWLNGERVADMDTAAPEWAKALANERKRRAEIPAPGPSREGWLTFSDHTGTVYLRTSSESRRPGTSSASRWAEISTARTPAIRWCITPGNRDSSRCVPWSSRTPAMTTS